MSSVPPGPTYSFFPGSGTDKDRVRKRIGDKGHKREWFLSDQEILETLADSVTSGGFDEACAKCAEEMGASLSTRATSVQQRNLKVSYTDRAKACYVLADRIRANAAPGPGDPPNPGVLVGQAEAGRCPEVLSERFPHSEFRFGGEW